MKEAMFLCTAIAVLGALLRLFAETAGGKTAEKVIGTATGVLIALILAGAALGNVDLHFSVTTADREDYFQSLSKETLNAVCAEAEMRLSESLSEEIGSALGTVPKSCTVSINRETFDADAVTVVFDAKDFLVGSYEVKKYVGERLGVEAEVYFE